MSSTAKHHRREVRNFRRDNQKRMLLDSFIDFFYMIFGISMITGVLLFVLNYWVWV
jgi:hypothetical protein